MTPFKWERVRPQEVSVVYQKTQKIIHVKK